MQEVMSNPPVVVRTDGNSSQLSHSHNGSSLLQKYLEEIGRFPLLTKDEQIMYARLAQAGTGAARDHLIKCNLRLVVYIAKEYQHRGLPLLDLIEEGNLGLIHALDKFNPELGFSFSTYATYWIRHKVDRAIMQQGKIVRVPVNKQKEINAYLKKAYQHEQLTGYWPKPEQILGKNPKQLKKIRRDLSYTVHAVSLDAPINYTADNKLTIGDTLFVEETHCPYSYSIDHQTVKHKLRGCLGQLSEQQQDIICMRFGLSGEPDKTLDEIARHLNLSRERIRQIQNRALLILKEILESKGFDIEAIPLA